jgi:hypothetical protein
MGGGKSMTYRIDYYSHDKKVGDASAPRSIEEAVYAARKGLIRNQAHYARIVDPDRADKVVKLVHRDVLP